MLPDKPETFLIVGNHRILEPEQAIWLELLAKSRRFYRRQPMMNIVEQVNVRAERRACGFEQLRD
jgi:hypothetical protein